MPFGLAGFGETSLGMGLARSQKNRKKSCPGTTPGLPRILIVRRGLFQSDGSDGWEKTSHIVSGDACALALFACRGSKRGQAPLCKTLFGPFRQRSHRQADLAGYAPRHRAINPDAPLNSQKERSEGQKRDDRSQNCGGLARRVTNYGILCCGAN
jgi:hypothetical protein